MTLWLLAILPILLLVGLVASGRVRTIPAAALTLASVCLISILAFEVSAEGLTTALSKGLWTGLWIAAVIWAALLLNAVSTRMGIRDIGTSLGSVLPRETENILIVAWIFPSFVQGVAGFGTPIALAAPMLLAMGVRPVLAVALPVIGYHWAVGFGSVGSSFYMGALTAQLSSSQILEFAIGLSILLGINAILAGVLVALMFAGRRGLRESWRLILVAGPAMAVAQALAVRLEPGVGSLAGGAAGLAVVGVMAGMSRLSRRLPEPVTVGVTTVTTGAGGRPGSASAVATGPEQHTADARAGGDEPSPDGSGERVAAAGSGEPGAAAGAGRRLALVMLPYFALLVLTLAVLVPSTTREWVRGHLTWGPSFGGHTTGRGFEVDAVAGYQQFSLLAHPGSFIVAATLMAILAWRLMGQWPRGAAREVLPGWARSARKATWSVLLFACVATVLADTGMVRTIADGVAEATGRHYPALAGAIGALGSFTTGSTTNSNALFSALQADVAHLIDVSPSLMLAAQTAGGNVGNAVAPVILLLGASAVGLRDELRPIFKAVLLPVAVLLAVVLVLTYVMAA